MQSEAKIAPRDKLEAVAMVLGCAPTQWGMLMFAKKLLWEAIGAVNKARANSYDEQIKIIDDSLRKVSICFKVPLIYTFPAFIHRVFTVLLD